MRTRIAMAGWLTVALVLGLAAPLAAATKATDVTPEKAQTLIQDKAKTPNLVILDVRTPEEFSEGHLSGAVNVNIAAPDFQAKLEKLDRSKEYLVYCRSGSRSQQAVRAMEKLDFKSLYHLYQGVLGWQEKKLPLVK
jgi:phage shock protein E